MKTLRILILFLLALHISHAAPNEAISIIEMDMQRVLNLYRIGDVKNAKEELQFARYHGFRNTGLEAIIKRELPTKEIQQLEARFSNFEVLIDRAAPYEELRKEIDDFLEDLHKITPNLPEITQQVVTKNWHEVVAEIEAQLNDALTLYQQNSLKKAITKIQTIYFDIFEESGMEQAILLFSEDRKLKAEQRFRTLSDMMKRGENVNMLASYIDETCRDFTQLAQILTPKADTSPISSIMNTTNKGLTPWLLIASFFALILPIALIVSFYRNKRK